MHEICMVFALKADFRCDIVIMRQGSEQGGMTKTLILEDEAFFHDLVMAINPKIIICLG